MPVTVFEQQTRHLMVMGGLGHLQVSMGMKVWQALREQIASSQVALCMLVFRLVCDALSLRMQHVCRLSPTPSTASSTQCLPSMTSHSCCPC